MPDQPDPAPAPKAMPNSFWDFYDRMMAVADEAQTYGIATVFAMEDVDPIKRTNIYDTYYNCVGYSMALGMAHRMVRKFNAYEDMPEDDRMQE